MAGLRAGRTSRRFVLGVDGGGTKTLCLAVAEDGTLLGRGEGGPANPYSYGMERSWQSIASAVDSALAEAATAVETGWSGTAAAIYLGVSGVERPNDVAEVQARATTAGWAPEVLVSNDAVIALAAGLRGQGGPGVVVIAGTGSIVYGVDAAGRTARAGGWGPFLGDEGSGYDIGRRALIAVVRAHDGRGQPTELTDLARRELGFGQPEELITMAYGRGGKPPLERYAVARLCGIVSLAAVHSDAVAVGILDDAARQLVEGVGAVAGRLGLGRGAVELPVVATGGVFRIGGEVFSRAFQRELAGLGTSAGVLTRVVRPSLSPAAGAALRALGAIGVDPQRVALDPRLEGRDL